MTLRLRFALLALGLVALVAAPARAVDKNAVQRAIDRGVAYLKANQGQDGKWNRREIGATALAGLTLLECGVPAKDPSVQAAANAVRNESVQLTETYSLALAIMFFDRLGDPADVPLIESMAVRLMAGQGAQGGWSYTCPAIGQAEAVRLTKLLRQRSELKGQKTLPPGGPQQGRRDPRQLTPEINQQLLAIARQAAVALDGGIGDNSNTQFATLGLWVARRHGLPVDRALQLVDQRFRGSQNADGGWSYVPMGRMPGPRPPMMGPGNGSTPAMTCAGLLGLAVHHGAVNDKAKEKGGRPARDPGNDAVVQAGLRALGTCIGKPQGNVGQAQAFAVPMIGQGRGGRAYYFLWSL
ncbi:MAG TPA: hypothetical protein VFA26_07425, partial [Gemmataceae bacterium]|nr:hypothetical protein [Gemmataceae bacterium]